MSRWLTLVLLVGLGGAASGQKPDPAKTDWLLASKYGVFVHYLTGLQNNPDHVASLGRQTSWDECVREFDVERFAGRMREAGAGYVIFTMMQRSRFLIAPNATFDRMTGYKPGEACATRDLVEELYQALNKLGIALMLYWTGDGPCDDPKAAQALRWQSNGQVTEEFVRNWAAVAREYGLRYKDKVKGFPLLTCLLLAPPAALHAAAAETGGDELLRLTAECRTLFQRDSSLLTLEPVLLPRGRHLLGVNDHLGWPVAALAGKTIVVAFHRNPQHFIGNDKPDSHTSTAVVIRSPDGGRTWSEPVDLSYEPATKTWRYVQLWSATGWPPLQAALTDIRASDVRDLGHSNWHGPWTQDTVDLSFNPVSRRIECVATDRNGDAGAGANNPRDCQTLNLWSIDPAAFRRGESQWRFEGTLLKRSGLMSKGEIDGMHPGAAVIDTRAGVQHVFIYTGTPEGPAGVFRLTRTLDTDRLRALLGQPR